MDNFEKLNSQYATNARKGGRVRYNFKNNFSVARGVNRHYKSGPKEGTITSCDGAYLRIRFDGEEGTHPAKFHPTYNLEYID